MRPQPKLRPQAKLHPQSKAPGPSAAPETPGLAPTQRPEHISSPPTARVGGRGGAEEPVPPGRPPPLRQVVEAYFSDDNLKQDRYLRGLIAESPGGWVDMDDVLALKRVRVLKAKRDETLRALRESKQVELWRDPADGSAALRRRQGPLPALHGGARAPAGADAEEAAPPDEEAPPAPAPEPALKQRRAAAEVAEGRFVGRIKSFHPGLGMGFIACRPTFEVFGRDIAIERAELAGFATGHVVAFRLSVDPDFGTPKAVGLRVAAEADADRQLKEPAKPGAPRAAGAPAGRATKRARGSLVGMRFAGKILSFNPATKMGKIDCPELFAALGSHIIVSEDELAGFDQDDRVTFALRASKAVELEAE
mmetsp:Transcript_31718/g.91007  ORF Transcript_31718/g.91007 Transcript_31718/m.91007 type:complete len:365 (-) Transcript_31718:31-1125(-)